MLRQLPVLQTLVAAHCRFYTRVLGMRQLPRPPFPFAGAWLQGGGLTLHLIDDDPTIPRKGEHDWKVILLCMRHICRMWQTYAHAPSRCKICRTGSTQTTRSPGTSGEARTKVSP